MEQEQQSTQNEDQNISTNFKEDTNLPPNCENKQLEVKEQQNNQELLNNDSIILPEQLESKKETLESEGNQDKTEQSVTNMTNQEQETDASNESGSKSNENKSETVHKIFEEIIIEDDQEPAERSPFQSQEKEKRTRNDENQKQVIQELKKQIDHIIATMTEREKDAKNYKQIKEQDEIQKKNLQAEIDQLKAEVTFIQEQLTISQREACEYKLRDEINKSFDENQIKFTDILVSYNQDLKEVFHQISNNPILEKYKKQNDDLLIENTKLRQCVIQLEEDINNKRLEELEKKSKEGKKEWISFTSKEESDQLYETMMKKFSEMDERMTQNDNEKFEALQQQHFWFNKAQQLEKEISLFKEQQKLNENTPTLQPTKTNSKRIARQPSSQQQQPLQSQQAQSKQQQQQQPLKKRKSEKNISDDEDESKLEKKIKPSEDEINDKSFQEVEDIFLSSKSEQQILDPSLQVQTEQKVEAPIITQKPLVNTPKSNSFSANRSGGLFNIRLCPTCSMTIKKAQPSEPCTICQKDIHTKCKGDTGNQQVCKICFLKQNKQNESKSQMEEEKE